MLEEIIINFVFEYIKWLFKFNYFLKCIFFKVRNVIIM